VSAPISETLDKIQARIKMALMGADEESQAQPEALSEALRRMDDALKGSGWHVVMGRRGQFRLIPFQAVPEGAIGSASVAPRSDPDDDLAA